MGWITKKIFGIGYRLHNKAYWRQQKGTGWTLKKARALRRKIKAGRTARFYPRTRYFE